MLIPEHYVIRANRDEVSGQRSITVRRYTTSIPFNPAIILDGLAKSKLVIGKEFGVLSLYDIGDADADNGIRALCGLAGQKNIILLNEETNNLDYLRIDNVIVATMMIEFIKNANDQIELLVYGGKQGRNQLWFMLQHNFGIYPEPIERLLTPYSIRSICERYFDYLTTIHFKPFDVEGWKTIHVADYKANRGQYISPNNERMEEIYNNKDIGINSFESVLFNQSIVPMLKDCNIKFQVLSDSGVNLSIPELEVPRTINDLEYSRVLYSLARHCYNTIIEGEHMFFPSSGNFLQQLTLLK